jgi:hypothetical protein
LKSLHRFGTGFALLFDLILNPVEQSIKFAVQLKKGMIRRNRIGRQRRHGGRLKRNQRCSFGRHKISGFVVERFHTHVSLWAACRRLMCNGSGEEQHLLSFRITGTAETLWNQGDPADRTGGTHRFLAFRIAHWLELSLPAGVKSEFLDYSPYNPTKTSRTGENR